MVKLSKAFSTIIIAILIVSSLIIIKPTSAQIGVTTPFAPSFGVNYEIFPIEIPPVYGVDQSTGKAVITKSGYTAYDETVFITILNQPFVPYKDSNGNNIQLFYSIRWKEPSTNSWVDPVKTTQSIEERTICTFDFMGNYHEVSEGLDIPIGSETDFQVEASIGYYTTDNVFIGKTSGWTNPQSITHAANYTTTITPNPSSTLSHFSATPSVQPSTQLGVMFSLNWEPIVIIILVATVVVLAFALVLSRRRSAKQPQKLSNASVLQ